MALETQQSSQQPMVSPPNLARRVALRKLRPGILAALTSLGHLTVSEIARIVYKARSKNPSTSQASATRRAVARLSAIGDVEITGRFGRRKLYGSADHSSQITLTLGVNLTNQLEAILSDLDRNEQERRDLLFRLRAATRAPAVSQPRSDYPVMIPNKGKRYVLAATAFGNRGLPFEDAKVRQICRKHTGDGGFAVKMGKWYVREPEFSEFWDRVERISSHE